MKTNQEYKNEALAALKGNWAPALVASIAVTICVAVCTGPAFVSNMAVMGQFPAQISLEMIQLLSWIGMPFTILFMYPLLLGYTVAHRNLLEGDADVTSNTFGIAFSGWLRNVWAVFLMYLFTILWTFLLIIPGIIKGLAYSLTPYILKDYPELTANQAINLSQKMMKGHKFDLFYLGLSFIGWFLLGMFTLGIGYIWLMPYMYTAFAAFYQDVKKEYLTNN